MRYFSIIPNPEIVDTPNKIEINDSIFKEIECTSKFIKVKFKEEYAQEKEYEKEYTIVEFNVLPGIHSWIEETVPIELLWTASADFLENLGKNHNIYIFREKPKGLESLLSIEDPGSLLLPFQVRGSRKTLFPNVFNMVPVGQKFLSPLETISESYEEYIKNAIHTYKTYVIPTGEDAITRFQELMDVVIPEVDKIEERFRIFTRIISPLVHYVVLRNDLAKSLEVDTSKPRSYSFTQKTSSKLSLSHFAKKLSEYLKD